MIRRAILQDISKIHDLEKTAYQEFALPESILRTWMVSGNLWVKADGTEITGAIFFEFLSKPLALPRIHTPLRQENKNYVYVSEAVSKSSLAMQELFSIAMKAARINRCKGIIWLASERRPQDFLQDFLTRNGFRKQESARNWERLPGIFVDNFNIWIKEMLTASFNNPHIEAKIHGKLVDLWDR